MAKPPRANTTRTPPDPSENSVEVDDWTRRVMPDLHSLVEHVDSLIRKTIPDLRYAVKWKKAYYGVPDLGWLIEMVAYDVSVNVVFLAGADFESPPPLGDTGRSRYVKLRSVQEAKDSALRSWVEQAAKVPGWK